jgi:tetratricopeptide (TPR) repeat protein
MDRMITAKRLLDAGRSDEAIAPLQRAKALFPHYGGDDSPTWYLAQIYLKRGDTRQAADELREMLASNETNYPAYVAYADALQKLGDVKGAEQALASALYINPFELPLHQRLAELARSAGDVQMAVRERKAVVALGPVDRPEALYQLALAYRAAGDSVAARHTVLRALEDAPNFEKAQELLLTIHQERVGGKKP